MKNLFGIFALCIISNICFGQSQSELNDETYRDFKKAEGEMNRVYNAILSIYREDTIFIENLKKAQNIWLQLREAELAAKYPETEFTGSVAPMCWNFYKQELTDARIKYLNQWIEGIEEGDVCIGSVRFKE